MFVQLRYYCIAVIVLLIIPAITYPWGFFAHERINRLAVYCLPPEMMVLYKPSIEYISKHATDPDKRRYAVAAEGARHFIDIDLLDAPPYKNIPRLWKDAVEKYSMDSLNQMGILPWHLGKMLALLTNAFKEKDKEKILRLSAELGHYLADAHVPLHACSNHNGQLTNQHGIHGLWESSIPEQLADQQFDYWAGKASYIARTDNFIWEIISLSGREADTVLSLEKQLSQEFPPATRFAYENRNGKLIRTYANAYTNSYSKLLNGMVERKMKNAIAAVAAAWYTCWVNAGQPSLSLLGSATAETEPVQQLDLLQQRWMEDRCR
ncbi:S1/P1 Nuclease [Chitinophaga silvatica]|uniref:S1/P1 Nuclease n=1 Tax=Chitinophaga silvatica TaxID=2282649 RepID=A0A3E1YCB8_9BACT|nr:zinc dependent phospholipase C family protein [Chitinophaga silvatica]RFS23889.1 S1/P1 Nuclease [Chitinophaga silvatica]